MRHMAHTWAVILAGGEGQRLDKIMTSAERQVIPTQYCSFKDSSCLLQDAFKRARSVTLPSHICAVVAAHHQSWWVAAAEELDESNVFIEPTSRGTGVGMLLGLLKLERRNRDATVVLSPANHYFRDEHGISRVLRIATNLACANRAASYLVGAVPEAADAELGYILPSEVVTDKPVPVYGFTEKPSADYAQELIALGALWNLSILIGSVGALLQLFEEGHARLVADMRDALNDEAGVSLNTLYTKLQHLDFSRDLLELQAHRLQVIRASHCGWANLGTLKRVEARVRSLDLGAHRKDLLHACGTSMFLDRRTRQG